MSRTLILCKPCLREADLKSVGHFGVKRGRPKQKCDKCKALIKSERVETLNERLGLKARFELMPIVSC